MIQLCLARHKLTMSKLTENWVALIKAVGIAVLGAKEPVLKRTEVHTQLEIHECKENKMDQIHL